MEIIENLKNNKWLKWVVAIILEIIVLLLVFRAGMVVGLRKADFNNRWGANYGRMFGEPRRGFFGELGGGETAVNAFGNSGTVLNVQGNTITIKSRNNNEKTVVVGNGTTIRELNRDISINDIKPNDLIVVIGDPGNNGQIEAKFIRIFPPMPQNSGASTSSNI